MGRPTCPITSNVFKYGQASLRSIRALEVVVLAEFTSEATLAVAGLVVLAMAVRQADECQPPSCARFSSLGMNRKHRKRWRATRRRVRQQWMTRSPGDPCMF